MSDKQVRVGTSSPHAEDEIKRQLAKLEELKARDYAYEFADVAGRKALESLLTHGRDLTDELQELGGGWQAAERRNKREQVTSFAAFLSYAHVDDEHDRKQISQICQQFSKEIHVQTGKEFSIFQDREDIGWGQQWEERIKSSLNEVTFLIPVLSPAYFKSNICRDELQRFLDRELSLGHSELILPIYYVQCDLLEDENSRKNDDLAQELARRQNFDWRELRHKPITKLAVKKAITKMAIQIRDALKVANQTLARPKRPNKSNRANLPELPPTTNQIVGSIKIELSSKNLPTATNQITTEILDEPVEHLEDGNKLVLGQGTFDRGVARIREQMITHNSAISPDLIIGINPTGVEIANLLDGYFKNDERPLGTFKTGPRKKKTKQRKWCESLPRVDDVESVLLVDSEFKTGRSTRQLARRLLDEYELDLDDIFYAVLVVCGIRIEPTMYATASTNELAAEQLFFASKHNPFNAVADEQQDPKENENFARFLIPDFVAYVTPHLVEPWRRFR